MCYHVSHERNVFPQLGIPSDEKVVAHALPKIEVALQVMERQLAHGQGFLLGSKVRLADYYLLPSTYAFGFAPEAKAMYADFPAVEGWRDRMEGLPTVQRFRAAQPPRGPIEHARKWAISHRVVYLSSQTSSRRVVEMPEPNTGDRNSHGSRVEEFRTAKLRRGSPDGGVIFPLPLTINLACQLPRRIRKMEHGSLERIRGVYRL
jgi:hypothetical protein